MAAPATPASITDDMHRLNVFVSQTPTNSPVAALCVGTPQQSDCDAFATLPDEVCVRFLMAIVHTFSAPEAAKALCRMSGTSRRWYVLCGKNAIWRPVVAGTFDIAPDTHLSIRKLLCEKQNLIMRRKRRDAAALLSDERRREFTQKRFPSPTTASEGLMRIERPRVQPLQRLHLTTPSASPYADIAQRSRDVRKAQQMLAASDPNFGKENGLQTPTHFSAQPGSTLSALNPASAQGTPLSAQQMKKQKDQRRRIHRL